MDSYLFEITLSEALKVLEAPLTYTHRTVELARAKVKKHGYVAKFDNAAGQLAEPVRKERHK